MTGTNSTCSMIITINSGRLYFQIRKDALLLFGRENPSWVRFILKFCNRILTSSILLSERDVVRCDRSHPFYSDTNENLDTLRRLLMTYVMYDFDTGYVQGLFQTIIFMMICLTTLLYVQV